MACVLALRPHLSGMIGKTMILAIAASMVTVGAPAAAQSEGCAGNPGAGRIKLTMIASGVRSAKGEVAFTLYPDDPRRFLAKGGKLLRVRAPARTPRSTACFWVAPGHYAAATYHDENGDRNFNRTLFRPKEGYGFSNDAPTTTGLPSFRSARFAAASGSSTIVIRTRYPD